MAMESALNRTSFWADFRTLVFEPRKVFSFFASFEDLSPWLVFKIFWGFFVFSIVGSLGSVTEDLNSLRQIMGSLDSAFDVSFFSRILFSLEWWVLIGASLLKPFVSFFQLVASAGLCFLGLGLLGLNPGRVGFFKILMVFCFIGWLQVFKFILPGFSGSLVVGLWATLLGIYSMRWIFRTDNWTAFVAYSFGAWLSFFAGLALVAGATGIALGLLI